MADKSARRGADYEVDPGGWSVRHFDQFDEPAELVKGLIDGRICPDCDLVISPRADVCQNPDCAYAQQEEQGE